MDPTDESKSEANRARTEAIRKKIKKRADVITVIVGFILVAAFAAKGMLSFVNRDEVQKACGFKSGTPTSGLLNTLRTYGFSEASHESGDNGIRIYDGSGAERFNWRNDVLDGIPEGTLVITKIPKGSFEKRLCKIRFRRGAIIESKYEEAEVDPIF